jgi:hypothetical protein
VSPKEQDRIAGQLLLQTVVLDVEGIEDDDGKPLTYTRELGAKLLLDPEFRVFQAGAAYAGSIVAQRRKADEKLDTKRDHRSARRHLGAKAAAGPGRCRQFQRQYRRCAAQQCQHRRTALPRDRLAD